MPFLGYGDDIRYSRNYGPLLVKDFRRHLISRGIKNRPQLFLELPICLDLTDRTTYKPSSRMTSDPPLACCLRPQLFLHMLEKLHSALAKQLAKSIPVPPLALVNPKPETLNRYQP